MSSFVTFAAILLLCIADLGLARELAYSRLLKQDTDTNTFAATDGGVATASASATGSDNFADADSGTLTISGEDGSSTAFARGAGSDDDLFAATKGFSETVGRAAAGTASTAVSVPGGTIGDTTAASISGEDGEGFGIAKAFAEEEDSSVFSLSAANTKGPAVAAASANGFNVPLITTATLGSRAVSIKDGRARSAALVKTSGTGGDIAAGTRTATSGFADASAATSAAATTLGAALATTSNAASGDDGAALARTGTSVEAADGERIRSFTFAGTRGPAKSDASVAAGVVGGSSVIVATSGVDSGDGGSGRSGTRTATTDTEGNTSTARTSNTASGDASSRSNVQVTNTPAIKSVQSSATATATDGSASASASGSAD